MKKVFVRFWKIPLDEQSSIFSWEEIIWKEDWVSVYEAILEDDVYKLIVPRNTVDVLVSMSWKFREKNIFEVKWNVIWLGSDWEIVLRDIKIVRQLKNIKWTIK